MLAILVVAVIWAGWHAPLFAVAVWHALQHGLKSQGLEVLAISWSTIVVMLVVSAVVGTMAAVLPAVRAVRLNILTAIAADG